jgi:hypothetical protein
VARPSYEGCRGGGRQAHHDRFDDEVARLTAGLAAPETADRQGERGDCADGVRDRLRHRQLDCAGFVPRLDVRTEVREGPLVLACQPRDWFVV